MQLCKLMTKDEFKRLLDEKRKKVEEAIDVYLPKADTRPHIVHEAMLYSMKVGGKRLRPILLMAAYELFPSELDPMPACVAIESLHTYSLIHDDLPCMDNSDLRRGVPTCHKKFDEPIALLAGDALLTHALWLLADAYKDHPQVATDLVCDLGDAASSRKLIGGQVEDILGEREGKMTVDRLNFIHANKTAALITSAVTMGVRLSSGCNAQRLEAARQIGAKVGLAFQVIDDILDATSDAKTMGKPVGLDERNEKMTYVSLYGIEESRKIAEKLSREAVELCGALSGSADFFKALIEYMQNRIY